MAEEQLVEGETREIVNQLLSNGVPVPGGIAGCTVALLLYDKTDRLITLAGTSGIKDAATSQVYFHPDPADFKAFRDPMKARWQLTDAGGKVSFFPNAGPDTWRVRKP